MASALRAQNTCGMKQKTAPGPGLDRLALALCGRESKTLFQCRNKKYVAARTQDRAEDLQRWQA